jgi:hypothetical protein
MGVFESINTILSLNLSSDVPTSDAQLFIWNWPSQLPVLTPHRIIGLVQAREFGVAVAALQSGKDAALQVHEQRRCRSCCRLGLPRRDLQIPAPATLRATRT